MTRLWDKGAPLDVRVLAYTAGEDYALDERLVRYDVAASIAHATMLHAQKLLSDADCKSIESGLLAIADEDTHERAGLPDDDVAGAADDDDVRPAQHFRQRANFPASPQDLGPAYPDHSLSVSDHFCHDRVDHRE